MFNKCTSVLNNTYETIFLRVLYNQILNVFQGKMLSEKTNKFYVFSNFNRL